MARSFACFSLCWNPPPAGEDELAGTTPTKSSGTPTPTLAVSYAPTPVPAIAHIITLSLNNKLFKQFIKAYLKAQVPGQIALELDIKPCKQSSKTQFLNIYYGNLHMNCYQFC